VTATRVRFLDLQAQYASLRSEIRAAVEALFATHQYVVRVPERDRVRAALAAAGVETQISYPIPLHLQPCFATLGDRPGDCAEAERASAESVALPIYPELDDAAARLVVESLARALGGRGV
jgi:dTDP-4-amino-4,6-dideoxygalactose transaminase